MKAETQDEGREAEVGQTKDFGLVRTVDLATECPRSQRSPAHRDPHSQIRPRNPENARFGAFRVNNHLDTLPVTRARP